jgi:hypothetical protein
MRLFDILFGFRHGILFLSFVCLALLPFMILDLSIVVHFSVHGAGALLRLLHLACEF